ncbi:hypothetical protein, partial [Escherichia coli]|uniref:hypothetical protein n=1 Tax=Escherichia coli TaxID=562 RepID=UPI003871212F
EWVHVQLHQQKGMISLSPPTICNSAGSSAYFIFSILNRLSPWNVSSKPAGASIFAVLSSEKHLTKWHPVR